MGVLQQYQLIREFVALIPSVRSELAHWKALANDMPSPLKEQALASIRDKEFHCIGGSVYALYPGTQQNLVLQAIVALQTISDYLDNLCDRLQVQDDAAFRTLHGAFTDALSPHEVPSGDYYRDYPHHEDLYLKELVRFCRVCLKQLPYYADFQDTALHLARLYCELQVLKHLGDNRERLLRNWVEQVFDFGRPWQELAAASGSTLGIFFCFALAGSTDEVTPPEILNVYFPFIQGLHILLDYLIDQEEDREHGDLNFTFYYPTQAELTSALELLLTESRLRALKLPHHDFHLTVINGLLALYGSDPKAANLGYKKMFHRLSRGSSASIYLPACRALRKIKVV